MIGETVGNYLIVSKISVGGMGAVYRAEHTLIGKPAAVKVLHPELSSNRDIVNRFFNEAKATTSIKHQGIVEIFDFGYMASGHAYLVMEFLEGMSLADRIEVRGLMPEGEAAMMLRSVCSALAAAHAKGIVHRDLKPDNIFLVPDPDSATGVRTKILDFGIAKLTDIGLAGSATQTGAVMGTPTYMAPEQCRGTGGVDHRADLYSLGCIFYELVTGRPPFTELGAGELIGAHIYAQPDPPSMHHPIAKDTEKLIMELLSKQPDKRPQTAKELAQRLSNLAVQLGWITEGITAQGVRDLASQPVIAVPRSAMLDAEPVPSESSPDAGLTPAPMTPSSRPSLSHVEAGGRPTTLSGAASQSFIDVPRKSRKGFGIAMAASILIAGGTVAVVKITGDGGDKIAPATTNAPVPTPDPAPLKVDPPKVDPPAIDPPKSVDDPAKVDPLNVPSNDPPIDPVTKTDPTKPALVVKKPVTKRPTVKKPVVTKPDVKPVKPKCDQPPCIVRDGI